MWEDIAFFLFSPLLKHYPEGFQSWGRKRKNLKYWKGTPDTEKVDTIPPQSEKHDQNTRHKPCTPERAKIYPDTVSSEKANHLYVSKCVAGDFPGGAVVKNPPASAGDTGSSLGLGRSHMPRGN